jgi:hypothetical protein
MKHLQPPSPSTHSGKPNPAFRLLETHQNTIAGLKAVLVVADVEFDKQHDHFANLAGHLLPGAQLASISWRALPTALPALDADIIFICSIRDGGVGFDVLKEGLKEFRGRNPKAVVAAANAHNLGSIAAGTLRSLESMKLVDHVKHADVFSAQFLADGVDLFARRQSLQ